MRTCKAWASALRADPNLWRAIALRTYPRLLELSAKVPGRSWAELYQAHHEMTVRAEKPTNKTRLKDYLLTYELMLDSEVIVTWTGALEERDGDHPAVQLWTDKPAALPVYDDALTQLSLRGFATRCVAGKPMRMVKLFECSAEEISEPDVAFGDDVMPHKAGISAFAHLLVENLTGNNSEILARLYLNTDTGLLGRLFRIEYPHDILYHDLKCCQILTYLEQCVPWEG